MSAAAQQTTATRARTAAPAARAAAPARREASGRGLHGGHGNQHTLASLRGLSIQPRMRVNAPGDSFEQEADRVADQVMRMSSAPVSAAGQPPRIQRKCAACGGDQEPARVQRRCAACEEKVQRRARGEHKADARAGLEAGIDGLRSGGVPLPAAARNFFEPRFGRDFSGIRVHTGARAAALAAGVDALAFTTRNHIVFGSGQYQPDTASGRNLLAHELTHTIQQGAGHDASPAAIQRRGDPSQIQQPLGCDEARDYPASEDEHLEFGHADRTLSGTHKTRIQAFVQAWHRSGGNATVRIDGYASPSGSQSTNWRVSCERANAVKAEMVTPSDGSPGIDPAFITVRAQGEETKFNDNSLSDPEGPNRRVGISLLAPAPAPVPTPVPAPPPPCPILPTTTPTTCADRNKAYCDAAACFPANPWLNCVCVASGDVCRAVNAFTFTSIEGRLLEMCIAANGGPTSRSETLAKAAWLLATNSCIWGHWRAAFDAIHDPAQPVPTTLTPEWARAVRICRSSGVGSRACCRAHVTAEQMAINRCGAYPSVRFGRMPTEVPGAPVCSSLTRAGAPGLPFPLAGDFGVVADRIAYGIRRCC